LKFASGNSADETNSLLVTMVEGDLLMLRRSQVAETSVAVWRKTSRNAIIAQASHCLIAIGDSHGTLSEVALGLRLGKAVFGVAGVATLAEVSQMRDVAQLGDALAALLLQQPAA
jgi:hypothetical protein